MDPVASSPIRLQVADVSHLFNTLDPSPFLERDLDARVESYIVESAQELPNTAELQLDIQVREPSEQLASHDWVQQAIQGYFVGRAEVVKRDIQRLLREGRFSLLIGLVFLALCLGLSRLLEEQFVGSRLIGLLSESLVIGGWVAMWRPLEIFLYEWWPLRQQQHLLARLGDMPVRLRQL